MLLWLAGAMAGVELPEPPTQGESARAPRFEEDPSRPIDAPTAEAIDRLIQEDGPAAGVTLATKALSAGSAQYGPRDARLSRPLINLGAAKQRAGDVAGALRDYRTAIDLVEASGGPRDPRLFDAWYGTGYTQLYSGNYSGASEALGTALQLHRVNQGLYSVEQLDVLHAFALALRAQGKAEDADAVELRRMQVAQRAYDAESPDLAKVFVSGGRWYRGTGDYVRALQLEGLALGILDHHDKDDPRLIEPLLELAISGTERRRGPDDPMIVGIPQPGTALARAERLAEARKDGTVTERAATLIRVGDVHYLIGKRDSALRTYAKAAAILATEGRQPPFDQPAFISFRVPRPTPLPDADGYALAEFSVDTRGGTDDVKLIESRPATLPPAVGASLVSALKQAHLRPRIVNGQPVESDGLRFRLALRRGSGQ